MYRKLHVSLENKTKQNKQQPLQQQKGAELAVLESH